MYVLRMSRILSHLQVFLLLSSLRQANLCVLVPELQASLTTITSLLWKAGRSSAGVKGADLSLCRNASCRTGPVLVAIHKPGRRKFAQFRDHKMHTQGLCSHPQSNKRGNELSAFVLKAEKCTAARTPSSSIVMQLLCLGHIHHLCWSVETSQLGTATYS